MGFPRNVAVLDNFNRANSTNGPGANWSTLYAYAGTVGFGISGSQADPNSADYVAMYWNPSTYGPDMEVYATFNTLTTGAGDGPFLYVRMTSPGASTTGYFLAVESSGTAWKIFKKNGATETQLGVTVNGGCTAGDKIGLEIIGTTLNAYRFTSSAWSLIMTRTDSTFAGSASCRIGMYIGANEQTTRLDDFTGGNIAESLTMPSILKRQAHLLVR